MGKTTQRETMSQFRFSGNHKKGYTSIGEYVYYSKRYNRYKTIPDGMWSDGATGFIDLGTDGILSKIFNWFRKHIHKLSDKASPLWFFVHDAICNDGEWDDGAKIDNWSASTVAGDILYKAGYRFWSVPVWWATYLRGGGEARKNGMRRVVI